MSLEAGAIIRRQCCSPDTRVTCRSKAVSVLLDIHIYTKIWHLLQIIGLCLFPLGRYCKLSNMQSPVLWYWEDSVLFRMILYRVKCLLPHPILQLIIVSSFESLYSIANVFLSTYHMPGTVLSTSWINLFIFPNNPMSRYYYYCSSSAERETEVQKVEVTFPVSDRVRIRTQVLWTHTHSARLCNQVWSLLTST